MPQAWQELEDYLKLIGISVPLITHSGMNLIKPAITVPGVWDWGDKPT